MRVQAPASSSPGGKWRFLFVVAAVLCGAQPGLLRAQTYLPGQAYFDRSNYVEYIAGDMPVIFSAPHGGALTPAEIPDRQDDGTDPDFTTVTDSYTEEVALAVQNVFCTTFGHSPHVVICQLKRTKIDCNRSLYQGVYESNVYATIAWNDFQNYIAAGTNAAVKESGLGFYVDLHGQGHPIQRLELGYLLTADQLTNTDAVLNEPGYAFQSSIRSLAGIVGAKFAMPFSQILRGTNSFGGLMDSFGYPSVPDPVMPDPGDGTNPIVYPGDENPYFDGGYNTAVFSSQNGGTVDGVQIEANLTGVRDTAANRTNYAIAIARTLDYFFTNYYGLDLRLCAPCIWSPGAGQWALAANWGGMLPVAGNYILFTGPGGAVDNNLAALSTGTGRVYSMLFDSNAGPYTLYGNPISLNAGVTNYSGYNQLISNSVILLSPQTLGSVKGPLTFSGALSNGGFNLAVTSPTNVTFNNSLSGNGGLSLSGGGVFSLNAASTYQGATTNQWGTLLVNNASGCANGSGALFINSSAMLGGGGTVSGPVSIAGTVAPGNPLGELTVTNGLTLAGTGAFLWTLAANSSSAPGTNFSQIILTGGSLAIASNSALVLSFINSATPPSPNVAFWQSPQSWKIISLGALATNVGMTKFTSISNNAYAAGQFSCATDARGNVLLNFTPNPPPLISAASSAFGETNVALTWSSVPGVTYQLQFSTNLASRTWRPLGTLQAAGTNSTLYDTSNSPAEPQRFYRVIIP